MINPTGEKLEKLLFGIFDEAIQGVDTYNHNGSLWLIFTDEMRWVVEYTKEQTLWYNYMFFKGEMDMVGLDCVENKHLIQKWFELRFLNRNETKKTDNSHSYYRLCVEDTIQNGVKETLSTAGKPLRVEDAIENGVKHTQKSHHPRPFLVENTIQNGVKSINENKALWRGYVEDTIQNGIKETRVLYKQPELLVENTVQNGVKEVRTDKGYVNYFRQNYKFNIVLENGVKEIHDDCSNNIARVKGIVRVGEKIN